MGPRPLAVALLFLVVACSSARPVRGPPARPEDALRKEVDALASEARALLRAQDEQVWKSWTEGAHLDIGRGYEAHRALFSREAVEKIDRLRRRASDPKEKRALTHLHAHFAGEYLSAALAEVNEAIANLEASMTFSEDGREYPYRDLEHQLANERSAKKRAALYQAATPSVIRLTHSLKRREQQLEAQLESIGFDSYEALGSELRESDLEGLAELADRVLQLTQAPFSQVLGKFAQREIQVPLDRLRRSDLPRLFRPGGVDASFPKETLLTRAQTTLQGMGLDFAMLPNLRLDARELPKKNPRPLALGVDIPKDVRLSVKPAPGVREEAAVLHELGHALFFALTQEPRFELTKLGDGAVGEAYATVLENLLEDPVWLQEQGLTGDKLQSYLAAQNTRQLYLVRRAAGQLVYSLQLHRQREQDAQTLYHAVMSRACLLEFAPADDERYRVDQDELYQSADELQAWFLAGQLQAQLKARFGAAWWRSPKAGEFLKSLWARGNGATATEVARLVGEDGIKPDRLLSSLSTRLKVAFPSDVRQAPSSGEPNAGRPAIPQGETSLDLPGP